MAALREELAGLLERTRVLTLSGAGGTGKTRLVRRYGRSWLGDWPGGVYFCDLSDARTLDSVFFVIAVAAVRYFMVKFSRGKIIAFDIDEALSFEGETGPYLQYAVVRAGSIFRKAGLEPDDFSLLLDIHLVTSEE